MLETVREYAREKLVDSGECADVEERFGRFYLRLAELAEPELYGPRQEQWFARLDAECDNLRSALVRMRDAGEWQDGLRLAGALGWYWFRKARFSEGLEWLELFRRAVGPSDPTGPRARAAYYLGWMKLCAGSVFWGNPEGKKLFRESLALWRVEGNKSGIARSQVWLGWKEGVEQAAEWSLADESVSTARDSGDPWALALCLKVAYSHLRRPDRNLASRRAALEEAIVLARTSGDQFLLCQAYGGMGNVFAWIGELRQAEPWYREALRIAHAIDDAWSVLDVTNCLADAYLGLGEVTRAKPLFLLGLRKCVELGARAYVPWFVHGLREVAAKEGRVKRAARLWAVEYSVLDPRAEFDPRICRELNLERGAAEAEWSRGKLLSFDEAVRYACSDR